MNRVIKFRAWDNAVEEFWSPKPQGMIYFTLQSRPDFIDNTYHAKGSDKFVARFEVMQFTGLHDKNGVEIYEADIVTDHVGLGVVKYSCENAAFRVCYGDGRAKWFYDYLKSEIGSIRVIGNIYQNPELLA